MSQVVAAWEDSVGNLDRGVQLRWGETVSWDSWQEFRLTMSYEDDGLGMARKDVPGLPGGYT